MASDVRQYLRPEILAQIGSLELRARFVVEGFTGGMHESPLSWTVGGVRSASGVCARR